MSEKSEEPGQELRHVEMQRRFCNELSQVRANAAANCVFLTDASYQKLVEDVIKAKTTSKKESRDYRLLKRYDIMMVENRTKLIYPLKEGMSTIQFYIADSELFDVLHKAHLAIGHGGRDKMLKELSHKYKNITRHDIELYIHLCESCQKKQKGVKKGVVIKPMYFSEFNIRCQVDLIDFQSHPDGEYKFIMVYQDHLTKFVVLRALKSNKAQEVADKIVDIFTLLGAPMILQSDNGREFSNNVVSSLKEYWPTLKIVHGKPHLQSQGRVERTNQDIENLLCAWMQDEKTDRWSEGLRFVQLMTNRAFHSGIKMSPYEALFGCKARVGLTTSPLPDDVLQDVETEEELENIIQCLQTKQEEKDEAIIAEGVDENTVHDGVKQSSSEAMVIEETSICNDQYPSSSSTCCVCLKETSGAHSCGKCGRNVHANCGYSSKDDHDESCGINIILCFICCKIERAVKRKMESKSDLEIQAKNEK